MKYVMVSCLLTLAAVGGLGCGGGSGIVIPVLRGPSVIDFEGGPDDGFVGIPLPYVLAPGVTAASISAGAALSDFTNADGWGLSFCDAVAWSGTTMIGVQGPPPTTLEVVFDTPVARVLAYASEVDGSMISMEAFDDVGGSLGVDSQVSSCPAFEATDVLNVEVGANLIKRVVFTGATDLITLDDLSYWRFE